MKMVKNIAIVACAASFMFANVSFHMGNNYSGLDAASPNQQIESGGTSSAEDIGFLDVPTFMRKQVD